MNRRMALLLGGMSLGAVSSLAQTKTHLKVGDMAPDFELNSTEGRKIKLSEYRGKNVVLAFFPAAFTGG